MRLAVDEHKTLARGADSFKLHQASKTNQPKHGQPLSINTLLSFASLRRRPQLTILLDNTRSLITEF